MHAREIWQAMVDSWAPIIFIVAFRVITLIAGVVYTPPLIVLWLLQRLYWLPFAWLGWSLGRTRRSTLVVVTVVTAIAMAADFLLLTIYTVLPFAWMDVAHPIESAIRAILAMLTMRPMYYIWPLAAALVSAQIALRAPRSRVRA